MGDMRIVQEMYARGFEFEPIDIFRAQSRSFQIVDGKLMPSLNSIDGLGEKAADAIVEAAKDGPFLSKDDFRQSLQDHHRPDGFPGIIGRPPGVQSDQYI